MNARRLLPVLSLTVAAIIAAVPACRREVASVPPPLRPGHDSCAECGMLIAHDRFAGALRSDEGDSGFVLFDDLDCMLRYERSHPRRTGDGGCFVRDFATREWVDGEGAHYLAADPDVLKTPMGSGIVAFTSVESAVAERDRCGGVVLDAAQLRARRAQDATLAEHADGAGSDARPPGGD